MPIFAVGTVKDHVAPWQSVFKIDVLSDTDVTFVLTSGGHNAGIVSEPDHPRRTFRIRTKGATKRQVDPETWMRETPERDGSWWEAWAEWLGERAGKSVAPPDMDDPKSRHPALDDAPGTYVFQK